MKRLRILLLCSSFFCSFISQAQVVEYRKYKGKVLDEKEIPLNRVNIFSHINNARGTISWKDGSFEIEAKPNETINFEYVGRESLSLQLNEKDTIGLIIKMPLATNRLSEVTISEKVDIIEYIDTSLVFVGSSDRWIFQKVSEEASFQGEKDSLLTYLKKALRYPAIAVARREEGQVLVEFTISPEGKVDSIQIVKHVSPALDAEAERIVKNMPDWKPARQRGYCVSSRQLLPINFSIISNFIEMPK